MNIHKEKTDKADYFNLDTKSEKKFSSLWHDTNIDFHNYTEMPDLIQMYNSEEQLWDRQTAIHARQ